MSILFGRYGELDKYFVIYLGANNASLTSGTFIRTMRNTTRDKHYRSPGISPSPLLLTPSLLSSVTVRQDGPIRRRIPDGQMH